jgi:hypothetical protein
LLLARLRAILINARWERECLGEVAELSLSAWIVFLGKQAEPRWRSGFPAVRYDAVVPQLSISARRMLALNIPESMPARHARRSGRPLGFDDRFLNELLEPAQDAQRGPGMNNTDEGDRRLA